MSGDRARENMKAFFSLIYANLILTVEYGWNAAELFISDWQKSKYFSKRKTILY